MLVVLCALPVQLASMALYGDLATSPSVPAALPMALGRRLGAPLARKRVPGVLRIAYARALLHRGDARAVALIATLPDDADAADVRAQLAERGGDTAGALALYARAGDFERAQRLIDAQAAAGNTAAAQALELALVRQLSGNGEATVRARAWWRLGQITASLASLESAREIALEREALAYYDAALALAPNEETYLLAAGEEALDLGDRVAAARYYARALDAVPDSVDARTGLARARG